MVEKTLKKIDNIQTISQYDKVFAEIICSKDINNQKIVDTLEEKVISFNNPRLLYDLAYYVPNCNISKVESYLCQTNNSNYIYKLAFGIKGVDINKLQQKICDIKDPLYIYLFAKTVTGADIKILQNAICEVNNIDYIIKFAKNIKNTNKELLVDKICSSNNSKAIYQMATNVKNVNISKLQTAICKTGNAMYIYLFMKISGTDKDLLSKALLQTKDIKYIIMYLLGEKKVSLILQFFGNIEAFKQFIYDNNHLFNYKEFMFVSENLNKLFGNSSIDSFNFCINRYLRVRENLLQEKK